MLNQHEISDLIERLKKNEPLPEDYKHKLFPIKQKEYELIYAGKMRREDILANEDGVFPVPLQVEKIYNGQRKQWKDGWRNIIAFGDNLQFLKTVYEDKDPLIKNKVKGKVKLIYIDPPFGTGDEYEGNKGQKGYSAKSKGSEFLEFVRRRLFVAKEILSEDGSIFMRIDYRFGHYLKIVMDEVFGKNNFRNEIIVNRTGRPTETIKQYHTTHDVLYFFSKSNDAFFNNFTIKREDPKWRYMHLPGIRWTEIPEKYHHLFSKKNLVRKQNKVVSRARIIMGKEILAPEGRHWASNQDTIFEAEKQGKIKINDNGIPMSIESDDKKIGDNWTDIPGYSQYYDYPTENSEALLERVIKTATKEGELVLDFFGGSGTTAAVSEKLNRKWITCDIGKLAFYTMQKRLLNVEISKSIENSKQQYGSPAKSFVTVNTGHYDLKKIFDLKNQEYSDFVMNLFEVEAKKKTIGGIQIDGEKKDGYNVIVWQYWKFKDSLVDEDFLNNLHSHIGAKTGKRVYIIAPASYVDFISDYYEIDKVRYFFLKVPYHIIRELHKVQFKKFRQPQSKSNVNDLEDAIGFHFMRQPEVKSDWKEKGGEYHITIKKFLSDFSEEETERDMENFESLAMVLIDKNFDGETFDMDTYYFAEDLLLKKKKKADEEDENENIKEELKHINRILLPPIPKKECGKKLMIIYVDIYGNEFKEEFKLK